MRPNLSARLLHCSLFILITSALIGLSVLSTRATVNAAPPAQTTGLKLLAYAGFDGRYKAERWLPIRVAIENTGPDVTGEIQVTLPKNFPQEQLPVFTRPVELPTQSRREFFLYVPTNNRYFTSIEVVLKNGTQTLATATARVNSADETDVIVGVLAGSPSAFNGLAGMKLGTDVFLAQLLVSDLPTYARAWQSLDVLIISDLDTATFSADQQAALAQWVDAGGQLLVMGGPNWQKTSAGLRDLLPLELTGSVTLNDLGALGTLIGEAGPTGAVVVAQGALKTGAQALASAPDGTPLVVTQAHGFGTVTFLAADPALSPMREWAGLTQLFEAVAAPPTGLPTWSKGFTDVSGVTDAVRSLPNLELPSILLICGWLAVYVVLVVPVNYIVLRLIKRLELAWVTTPIIIIGITALAYIVGVFSRGWLVTMHQVSVVHSGPGAAIASVDQGIGLLSPSRTSYDVRFPIGYLVRDAEDPGDDIRVEEADQFVLRGVRSDIGAITAFVTKGSAPAPQFDAQLEWELSASSFTSGRIVGQVTNRSSLTLKDAVLLGPNGAQQLGDFAPGETRSVALSLGATTYGTYYYGNDATINDILGNGYYYENREMYRKYSLLRALTYSNSYSYAPSGTSGRGTGVYLVGWTDQAPVSAEVVNAGYNTDNLTLYLVGLPYALKMQAGVITLASSMMNWQPLDATTYTPAPYQISLDYNTDYQVGFYPIITVDYKEVLSLDVTVKQSYASGSIKGLEVSLWNFQTGKWVALPAVSNGRNTIANPELYVGPGGEVRVWLDNVTTSYMTIDSLEVALTVEK